MSLYICVQCQPHSLSGPRYLYNSERVGRLPLLDLDISVDTVWVGPGLGEGDEGTEGGDVEQPQVEPWSTSGRTDWY